MAHAPTFLGALGSTVHRGAVVAPIFTLVNRRDPSLATAQLCRQPADTSLTAVLHVLQE